MPHESVTIIDVAHAAGVSKSAAARVLAQKGSASSGTRERVLRAAEQLGYRPNHLARAMKSGATNTLGIVVPDVAIPFFSAVLRGFADTARAAGFEVLVSNTDNDADIETRSLEVLTEQRVDGIVVAPVFRKDPAAIIRLQSEGMPIVLLDRRMPGLEHLPLVSVDHAGATQKAISALIAAGHRRIALVTEATMGVPELEPLTRGDTAPFALALLRPSAQRLVGYLRAMRDAGGAVLVVSSELDEILALSDRVVVMNAGRITGELPIEACSEAALGRLMGGADATAVAAGGAVDG
jgi:LacI family transcriptional regulator